MNIYKGKTKLGQPIGRVLRLRDIYSSYENGPRLSVWDEVITIDRAMETLKDQLVEIDSRWTIDKLENISYHPRELLEGVISNNNEKYIDKLECLDDVI